MNKKLMVTLMAVLSVITVACVATMIVVLVGQDNDPPAVLAPDYAPQEEEPNAEPIPDDDSNETLPQSIDGGAVSLFYTTDVTVDRSDRKASLLFGNPQRSNQDIVLQIVVKDQIIVRSGRITPGNRVTALDLLSDAPELGAGTYTDENCKLVVLYYNRDSGEKSILNTEIPISLTVKE